MAEVYEKFMTDVEPSMSDRVRMVTEDGGRSKRAYLSAVAEAIVSEYEDELFETQNKTLAGAISELASAIDSMQGEFAEELEVDENGLVYLINNGERIAGPYGPFAGGGGGGGGGNNAKLTVTNATGWLAKTVSYGAECLLRLNWSSIEDEIPTGNGTLTVIVGSTTVRTLEVAQGDISVDVGTYLATGVNKVKLRVSDVYDNARTITFTLTAIELSIDSNFDDSGIFTAGEDIEYTFVATGAVEKTVHFVVDGTEAGTMVITTSGRQKSFVLTGLAHGSHSLRVYMTATIDGDSVTSNDLYYDLIVVNAESSVPIIASDFDDSTGTQYATLAIPYRVYTPNSLESDITLHVNGEQVNALTVDRTEHVWSYRPDVVGTYTLKIKTGNVEKIFTVVVAESDIDVEAETANLALYLTSYGRSNAEAHPEAWEDSERSISATLTGFNYTSDGWLRDADGITALRVSGDARVSIPYKPFASDFRSTGKTIEIEFATRNVFDYDAVIISCYSGDRGFKLTAQNATLKSEQSEIGTQYKEDEHVRISFVAEKRNENRLLAIYINGIMSGVVQYPTDDDFSQQTPVNISIGSSGCTTDVYCIRVYDNDLTRYQILDNWIADTQDIDDMLYRYHHNDVYNEYGQIVIDKLPNDLPYFILSAPELPQYKGDKKTITGQYVDPSDDSKSFTFTGCQINVQGTSSAPYARKNYDMQFKRGFELKSGHADSYALAAGIIPFNRFVLKADVASSEGANNVELVKLYVDTDPYKRREQEANPMVREGIYGFPITVFWNNTNTGETSFLGKYNFNLPKRAPAPYGYSGNMESWEFQNNTSDLMLFKTDYFDETPYTDPTTGDTKELWRYDYEARFPSDEWVDYSKLQEFQTFVVSCDRTKATGDALAEPVTYGDVTYTNDTADYRLARFKNEFGNYAEVSSFVFYYIFTELFLMVDSRAKNLFIGFSGSDTTGLTAIDRKVVAEPYDMDTAIGTNNEGSLVFGYSLEDVDHLEGGANVFNGQDSVLWNNVRDAFPTEIVTMYQNLRSAGTLSFATVEQRFEEHQGKWSESIFNEDAIFKYILPLTKPDAGKQPTAVYLPMLQGSKAEQRKWWLYNRFRYMDSKWNAGDALSDVIQLRGYAKADITVTPYADIYPTIKYGSYLVSERGSHGVPTALVCPLSTLNDTEIYIYSASQIEAIGDLSPLKVGFADLSMATRIQSLKLGDSDAQYTNGNLKTLTLGSNTMLASIDVRNCPNLVQAVDLSGCSNIEHVYFDGTGITGCSLPNGGILKTLQLPNTITNLTIRNQSMLTTFAVTGDDFSNVATLRIENTPNVPYMGILNDMASNSRVRLIGISIEAQTASEIEAFLDKLDDMRGLDESGGNVDKAQVSGTIHIGSLTAAQIADYNARYPYLRIVADHVSSVLTYKTWDGATTIKTVTCLDGVPQESAPSVPTRSNTAQYTFTAVGWNTAQDASTDDPSAIVDVTTDRTVYAAYSRTLRSYTATFVRASDDGGGTLYTQTGVQYGTTPTYGGSTPTTSKGSATDYPFEGWNPPLSAITADTTYTAKFGSPIEVAEITDSWDTILANIENGTYRSAYKVGNYKPLNLGTEGTVNMQIVAFDADVTPSGSTIPVTWIGIELLNTQRRWNPWFDSSGSTIVAAVGGWLNSEIRQYLKDTVAPLIPTNVASKIKTTKKYTFSYVTLDVTDTDMESSDNLWIPSMSELVGKSHGDETKGAVYSMMTDVENRKKKIGGSTIGWWTRSAYSTNDFLRAACISAEGRSGYKDAWETRGVPICFCLGTSEIDDS